MNKEELRHILQQPYQPENWKKVIDFVFPNVSYLKSPQPIPFSNEKVESFKQLGTVRLNDGKNLAMFEVKVVANVNIPTNRVELRSLVTPLIDQDKNHGVLVIYEQGSEDYRFTFTAKETVFDDEMEDFVNRETESKRFTYILGSNESCRTPGDRLWELSAKKEEATIKDIENAFSVERLSKEFFTKYKHHYQAFVDYLTGLNYKASAFNVYEKRIRDFVKVLLGRIVFLQFVQKKRWLGASDTNFNDGDKNFLQHFWNLSGKNESFYFAQLSSLFFDALNKNERAGQHFKMPDGNMVCVPFLGGGLFEKDRNEPDLLTFPPALFDGLFNFFAEYNFTIDENDPFENEVGIDPEMLGHIFENLLEDNKDKGAFYTPKPIVKYMCQESLIQYLLTQLEQNKVFEADAEAKTVFEERVERFVKKYEAHDLIDYDNILAKALHTIKVCDPAIGSGAFPMGILNEMVMLINVLHNASPDVVEDIWEMENWQPATVKKHIIQNSIYGVDIEKGAVDIARLRFWLSLILDEDMPNALPSLDYKIVVGNSLVSKLEDDVIDIDWELQEAKGFQSNIFGSADLHANRAKLLKKISHEQKEFFNPESDKKTLSSDIRNLKIELLINQLKLMVATKGLESMPTDTGKFLTQRIELHLKTIGWNKSIKKLKNLLNKPDLQLQYFDWKLDFPEIMNEQVTANMGFDVVIGNPPYVGHKGGMKELFRNLKDTPLGKMFNNERMDVFYYFFHLSINLANDKGIIAFITTNYYLTADSAIKLRKDFKKRTRIVKLVNFNELKVFESAMGQHNIMTFLTKNLDKKYSTIININKKGFANNELINRILETQDVDTFYFKQKNDSLFDGDKCYIRLQNLTIATQSGSNSIVDKIKSSKELLGYYCHISQGIVTGIDKVGPKHILRQKEFIENKGEGIYVLSQTEKYKIGASKLIKPWFKNSDIKRYFVAEKPTKWIIHTSVEINLPDYPNIEEHLVKYKKLITSRNYESGELSKAKRLNRWWALSSSRWEFDFDAPKIVSPQRSYSNTFAYTEKSWYASADVYFISEKENGLSLKYLLGILNSRLVYYWLYNRGKRKGEMLELYLTPISEIPIKKPKRVESKKIVSIVNDIIALKNNNPSEDTTKLEKQLDNLVYKLYDLLYEEVKVIDPEFALSVEEYDAIRLE